MAAIGRRKSPGAVAIERQFQVPFSRTGRYASPFDAYLALVALVGLLVGGWLIWPLHDATLQPANATFWLTFWLLAVCALPAEVVRVTTWHQGSQNQLTMSRPFVLALLIGWGAPLAVAVFMAVSVVSDIFYRKSPLRVAFNAAQYALSIAAAGAIYAALGGQRSFTLRHLPAFLAGTVVLIVVNRLLVRVGVALRDQRPMSPGYLFAYNPLVELAEAGVQFSWVLVALLVADHRPLLAVMLALPAVPLVAAGRAAEKVQTLMARRRGRADELAGLEQRRAAVLQMLELERVRFAADLHDGPVQRLGQHVERLRMVQDSIRAGSPDVARQLRQLEQDATAESRNLRDLVAALRPPVLQDLDLAGALTRLAQEFQASYGDIVFDVQTRALDGGLSERLEVVLYRVAQEALTNIVKHAHASHVQVAVAVDDGIARLQVHDDGTGFDPSSVPSDGHYGLALMRKRVELADGDFQVDSTPGRGTTIMVEIRLDTLP